MWIRSRESLNVKINKMELTLLVKAGENGKIFGGVTSKEIAEELKKNLNEINSFINFCITNKGSL